MNDEELRDRIESALFRASGGFGNIAHTEADYVMNLVRERDKSRDQQIALDARKKISSGDMHEAIMHYGKICEEQGSLSPKAVTIRMDLATYFNDLELATLKSKQEKEL